MKNIAFCLVVMALGVGSFLGVAHSKKADIQPPTNSPTYVADIQPPTNGTTTTTS